MLAQIQAPERLRLRVRIAEPERLRLRARIVEKERLRKLLIGKRDGSEPFPHQSYEMLINKAFAVAQETFYDKFLINFKFVVDITQLYVVQFIRALKKVWLTEA